jgi:drug/metabolite transporter (DMT)-like permease
MSNGILAATLVAVLWAISSLSFSLAGRSIGSGAVNHVRLWLALVLTAAVSAAASGRLLPALASPRQAAWLAASGLIGYVLGDAFLFEAFVLMGARVTMLVMTSVPVFGALFGLAVLGERPTPAQMAMMAVTLAGIAVVVGGRERGQSAPAAAEAGAARARLWGLVCAAGGAAGQAGGLLLSKLALQEGVAPFAANTVRLLAGAAGMGLWALARGRFASDFRAAVRRDAGPFVVAGAISGPVLGVALSLYAVARVDIGVASTLMQMSPIFLLPLSRIVTGDRITVRAVVGTVIAVAGGAGLFLVA